MGWYGELPENWKTSPIKNAARIVQGSTPDSSDSRNWSDDNTSLIWVTPADMDETGPICDSARHISPRGYSSCGIQLVPEGSVVISTRAPIGKVNRAAKTLCTNQGCKSLVPTQIDAGYLYWTVVGAKEEMIIRGRGTTFMELAAYDLGHINVPVPPAEEQPKIAACLDRECTDIDRVITAIGQQIFVLERYRASVIHEAVTKGLNPNAPMKPSGIDWINNIPKEWEAKSFKFVASVAAHLVNPSEYPELIEIDPENIESNSGRLVNVVTAEEVGAISAKQLFSKGQILYSKIRPSLNKVVVAPEDGLCSADMYPITTGHDARWLLYVMRSDIFVQQTSLISNRVAMPKINVEQLGRIKVPVPRKEEQTEIADYLDAIIAAIDTVRETKRKQIDVLKRRRQSLIYEYVTGKRHVGQEI